MSDNGEDAIAWLVMLVVGLTLLIAVSVVAAIVWLIVSSIAWAARKKHLSEVAGERFDQTIEGEGLNVPQDDALKMMYEGGIEYPDTRGMDGLDLVTGAAVGMGIKR